MSRLKTGMDEGPVYVYSLFAGSKPLYVGQTDNLARRMAQHAWENARWYDLLTTMAVITVPTRREALWVEGNRIAALRPLHNKIGASYRWSVQTFIDRHTEMQAMFGTERIDYPDTLQRRDRSFWRHNREVRRRDEANGKYVEHDC